MRIHEASGKRQLSVPGENAEVTLRLAEAISDALADPHAILDVILRAADEDEAIALVKDRFRFDDVQARAVLNTQFRRATQAGRRAIEAEIRQVRAALDEAVTT